MEKPEKPGVVETGDDTPHTIEHVGEVPLNHVGQKGKLMKVLHVPTITTNLVSSRLLTRGCRFDLRTSDASSKKRAKFSRRGTEKGRCLSTKQTKSNRDVCKRAKGRVGYQKVLLSSYEVKYDL